VIYPEVRGKIASKRCPAARLEEAVGLAGAIDLDVVHSAVHRVARPKPATLLGKGVIDELAAVIRAEEIGLCVVDAALTPIQQRNLEQA
jgi:GTP-binding protein HflX